MTKDEYMICYPIILFFATFNTSIQINFVLRVMVNLFS
jgi:hypothetical protein